jgi:hypothetical protein
LPPTSKPLPLHTLTGPAVGLAGGQELRLQDPEWHGQGVLGHSPCV